MDEVLIEVTKCEVCGADDMVPVLDLGSHPMCDDLIPIDETRSCQEFPIEIMFCGVCRTANQRFQIPKELLFPKSYHYRSRLTADVLNGMGDLVDRTIAMFGDLTGKVVLDVGCNDGSLLSLFKNHGAYTIGVEPTDAADDTNKLEHKIYKNYFDEQLVSLLLEMHGHPDFITFTNVFAHIERLDLLLKALKKLMGPDTILIVENHYLGSVLDQNQFDTFYHEHPRTYSFTSFQFIARILGVDVVGLEFPKRYGGNIRVFMGGGRFADGGQNTLIQETIEREKNFTVDFMELKKNMLVWKSKKTSQIAALHSQYGLLYAKAFPGRAAILVKLLNMNETVFKGVFEKPGSPKIGHYIPGTKIPILSDNDFEQCIQPKHPIINLAWHISSEIHDYLVKSGFQGKIVDILDNTDFHE